MLERNRRPCPACKSNASRSHGHKNGFEILVCRSCRTIFTSHLPSADEAQDYDEYYSESNLSVPGFIRERLREIIGEFSTVRNTNRLLDIGFGAATLLEVAAEEKWMPFGLEVSKAAVEHARRRGFEVFHGTLAEACYPENYFDVITASEILEHLPNPDADLKEIVRLLRPGGLFWATTPSAGSLSFRALNLAWSVLSPPDHLQLYSKSGAFLMLKNAGFSEIKFRTCGLNPAELLNHFRNRGNENTSFDRVRAGYELNERFTKSPFRKLIKGLFDQVLDVTRLGDSLKIFARK